MTVTFDVENQNELPIEENFVEQAEYIDRAKFLELSAQHPDEVSILKKLMGGGAKLLIGPRGCGKSTLMRKAFFRILESGKDNAIPIYVNFKLALKLEPFYVNGPNATYWFKAWLVLKVLLAVWETKELEDDILLPSELPPKEKLNKLVDILEASRAEDDQVNDFSIGFLTELMDDLATENNVKRVVILIDDAAHSFSEKQQEDFFDFFRAIKSRTISPKAAVYPGITAHSASFHVGHDAEQIDAWVKPSGQEYEEFMLSLANKRFAGTNIDVVSKNEEDIRFLAYCSFGIPRAFLGMLRSIYNSQEAYKTTDGALNKNAVLRLSRSGRDMSHAVFDSLSSKLPSYQSYVTNGTKIYQAILSQTKDYNRGKELEKQGLQFAIRTPIEADIEKVFGFLQYSGLIMPSGSILKGEKGSFQHYHIHTGDMTAENVIVGQRTKSIASFLKVIRATKHQAWPRLTSVALLEAAKVKASDFTLSLPVCHVCGTPRSNPEARFCSNCGTQLKPSSAYEALVGQPISVLPISKTLDKRIRENSNIRKVRDILLDVDRRTLLGIPYVGKIRAQQIVGHAEEHVS